jgi:TetR/AcrR family transcriptional regulator, mexJK operon transcriptional repressor
MRVAQLRKNTKQKYDAILNSASRLFLKNGYTHTSMDAIAADADVSKQTVYSYFNNKELLFRRMVEELCNSHTPSEDLLENKNLTQLEALWRIGKGFMDAISSRTGLGIYRLVMAEGVRHPRIGELFFQSGPQKMQQLLCAYLQRQVDNDLLMIDNVDRAATQFFAILKGWYQMRLVLKLKPAPSQKELDDYVRDAVRMFCTAYHCDAHALR